MPLVISRAMMKKDYVRGLLPYTWCLIYVCLKLSQAILIIPLMLLTDITLMDPFSDQSITQQILQRIYTTGWYTIIRYCLWYSIFVLGMLAALRLVYFLNVWLLKGLANWQRRHTWRILTTSDVLRVMLLSEDFAGPRQQQAWSSERGSTLASATDVRQFCRPGRHPSWLEDVVAHFVSACKSLHLRDVPRIQVLLQWLIGGLPIVSAVLTQVIYLSWIDHNIGALPINYFSHGSPAYRVTQMATTFLLILIWYTITIAAATIPASRRMGIRRALQDYLTADSLTPADVAAADNQAPLSSIRRPRYNPRLPVGDRPC